MKNYKLTLDQVSIIVTALQVRINENEKYLNSHSHLLSDNDKKILKSITTDAENCLAALGN